MFSSDTYYQPDEPAYEREYETTRDMEHECTPDLDEDDEGFMFFTGDVEVTVTDRGPGWMRNIEWTCPLCQTKIADDEDWTDE